MIVNTRKDGIAQFKLTSQEFRCLEQAMRLMTAMSRHLPGEKFDYLSSASIAIKTIRKELSPESIEEKPLDIEEYRAPTKQVK